MSLVGPINTGVAAGGAGVATSNYTHPIPVRGRVLAYAITYNDTPAAGTTDVTIATAGTGPLPVVTLAVVTNSATDVHANLMHAVNGADGAAIANVYDNPVINDFVTVTIAGADNGDSADVWLIVEAV